MTITLADQLGDLAPIIEATIKRNDEEGLWAPPSPELPGGDPRSPRLAAFLRWGVPYQEALFVLGASPAGPLVETAAMQHARDFHATAGYETIMVLSSPSPGTGKTIAAAWLMEQPLPPLLMGRRWASDQHPRFIHATELVDLAYRGDDTTLDTIAALRRTSMLVIDDLGTERLDGAGIYTRFVGGLLNARYGSGGITAITTNCTNDEILERYGDRVYDRLKERAAWFEIEHRSLRRSRS